MAGSRIYEDKCATTQPKENWRKKSVVSESHNDEESMPLLGHEVYEDVDRQELVREIESGGEVIAQLQLR